MIVDKFLCYTIVGFKKYYFHSKDYILVQLEFSCKQMLRQNSWAASDWWEEEIPAKDKGEMEQD